MEVFNEAYSSVLRYESKSDRVATEPFSRVDSPNCSMWHRLARNASIFEDMDDVMCLLPKQRKPLVSNPNLNVLSLHSLLVV